MQSFGAFIMSLIAAGNVAIASPAAQGERTFQIPAIVNPAYHGSGPLEMAKVYKKYGVALPEHLASAVEEIKAEIQQAHSKRQATGTTPGTNVPGYDDSLFLGQVQIGTPPQKLNLAFDTGAGDLWVLSSETPANRVHGQPTYNIKASSSAELIKNATWGFGGPNGGGSSASGDVYYDTVSIAGIAVVDQAVQSVTNLSGFGHLSTQQSGVLGFSVGFQLSSVSPIQQTTWLDNIQSDLKAPVATFDLKHNANGVFNFGYIDPASYSGTIGYSDVTEFDGTWSFDSVSYRIGTQTAQKYAIGGPADSGSALVFLPDQVVGNYYGNVKGARYSEQDAGYVFPCQAALPDFAFTVGGVDITIPGRFFNFGTARDHSGATCFGALQSGYDLRKNIWGTPAFKSALVVLEPSTPRLGWATKKI